MLMFCGLEIFFCSMRVAIVCDQSSKKNAMLLKETGLKPLTRYQSLLSPAKLGSERWANFI